MSPAIYIVELTEIATGEVTRLERKSPIGVNWASSAVKAKMGRPVITHANGRDAMDRKLVLTHGGRVFACRIV